uniref:Pro-corazonin n=1 Tax=Timema genevievae TaxID=629358 RepID=A0A7R9JNZ3_TIMGE|nr:unnamed protein product [Timema genevievae]
MELVVQPGDAGAINRIDWEDVEMFDGRYATFKATIARLANALVVLSSTAEDGEIEFRISVGSRVPVLVILLSCLTGIILAQTFQYSRGWTNGRKRAFVVPRAPVIVAEETLPSSEEERDPCQLQRMKYVLEGSECASVACAFARTLVSLAEPLDTSLYAPCNVWRGFKETASDDLNDRYKRDTSADVRHSLKNNNSDAKMADRM